MVKSTTFFKWCDMDSKSLIYLFIKSNEIDYGNEYTEENKMFLNSMKINLFGHEFLLQKFGIISNHYSINEGISQLLIDTENEFETISLNLPFDNIFIENDIRYKDYIIKGINVSLTTKLNNRNELLFNVVMLDIKSEEAKFISFYESTFKSQYENLPKEEKILLSISRKYFNNFLDLLNSENEIEYINFQYNKSELKKTNEKRLNKGKYPFSDYTIFKPFGKLKEYSEKYLKDKSQFTYNHSFKVTGHWRNLKSERYRTLTKKIWILPYIKGEGLLLDKITLVEK